MPRSSVLACEFMGAKAVDDVFSDCDSTIRPDPM